ncbi:MAG: hypothetical protein ACW98Y_12580 [Candidatus Thorarchaeota archaeon]|jgi:hypothetical protein
MRTRFIIIFALIFAQLVVAPTLVEADEVHEPFENTLPQSSLPENCSWAAVNEPFDDGPDYFKVDTFNITPSWNTLIIQSNTSVSFLDVRFYHNDTVFSTYRIYFENTSILTFNYPFDTLHIQVSSAIRGSDFSMSFWDGNVTSIPIFTLIPVTTITEYVTVTQNITLIETVTVIQNVTRTYIYWNTSYVYFTETVYQSIPLLADYTIWLPFTGSMFAVGSVAIFYLWNKNSNRPLPPTRSAKEMLEEIFEDNDAT